MNAPSQNDKFIIKLPHGKLQGNQNIAIQIYAKGVTPEL